MTEFHERVNLINYTKLNLDKEKNPRLPTRVMGKSDEEIIEYMIKDSNLLDLMASIGENGFFLGEPLLVVKTDINDEFVVVEGNRRLSAVMVLHNPTFARISKTSIDKIIKEASRKPFPTELPVIIYDKREEIFEYLGYRHITGVKPWDSLAKARYLRQLYDYSKPEDIEEKCRDLARAIGSRPDYVKRLLSGLSIYNAIESNGYFKIKGLDEETISFSLITTALGYADLRNFIGLETGYEIDLKGLNIAALKELTAWMFDTREGKTRLGESRNLGKLASVVANEVSLKEFRDGEPLEAAFYFSEGAKESVINGIGEAYNYLELAYRYAKEVTLEEEEHELLDKIIKTANAIKKQTKPE